VNEVCKLVRVLARKKEPGAADQEDLGLTDVCRIELVVDASRNALRIATSIPAERSYSYSCRVRSATSRAMSAPVFPCGTTSQRK